MESFVLVVFGITSDLSESKIIPALYDLERRNLLPDTMSIIGAAHSERSDDEFFTFIRKAVDTHHAHDTDDTVFTRLKDRLSYFRGDLGEEDTYPRLKKYIDDLQKDGAECQNKIFHLATFPELYPMAFKELAEVGLSDQNNGWTRVMIEKPIGHDLESAQELNAIMAKYFEEDQIYRLDHYLGKETLLNILYFRFANHIFEPLLNSEYVDHIQITAAEDKGIGNRGRYYDQFGALKDVGQNHLLQMLVFATMDCPCSKDNQAITDERIKLLKSIVPDPQSIVFGQYEGYTHEQYIEKSSHTDTFFAFKAHIHNNQFDNLPVYFRSGKMMKQKVTEISIVFKKPFNPMFAELEGSEMPSILIYRIEPNEGIVLKVTTKKSGHVDKLEETFMQYCYTPERGDELPDPYERLILNAFQGDQTYFIDAPEIEQQWKIIDTLSQQKQQPIIYEKGSWGPDQSNKMIQQDGREWLTPSLAFCRL